MSISFQSALITGGLMMESVLFLFILFLVVLFLYLRIRRRRVPNFSLASSPTLLPLSNSAAAAAAPLDPGVLKSLPSTVFILAVDGTAGYGPECAVCLSELADGELSRFLPGCRHAFHLECIDKWFLSNSTCPICRRSVEPPAAASESSLLAEEETKTPALTRLRTKEENSAYSSGGLAAEESSSNYLQISSTLPLQETFVQEVD